MAFSAEAPAGCPPSQTSFSNRLTRRAAARGLLACAAPFVSRGQPTDKPFNVVLLVSDQMRGDALSFLGGPNARTPNLDRLAATGVSFDNYFVNNPVCLPSRKSIFSLRPRNLWVT